jgi:hypothetical protein
MLQTHQVPELVRADRRRYPNEIRTARRWLEGAAQELVDVNGGCPAEVQISKINFVGEPARLGFAIDHRRLVEEKSCVRAARQVAGQIEGTRAPRSGTLIHPDRLPPVEANPPVEAPPPPPGP